MEDAIKFLFVHILSKFTNLQYLNLCSYSIDYQRLRINISPATVISSTLLELHVCLKDITDCFCLLDGGLNRLRKLAVKIYFISSSPLTINNKVNSFD